MIKQLTTRFRLSLGLSGLLVSLLLLAILLGLVPDRKSAVRKGRAALAEAIAIRNSKFLSRADAQQFAATIELIVERNPELLSAAMRRDDGTAMFVVGEHDIHWRPMTGEYSTDTQVEVPIFSGEQKWGQLELRFIDISDASWFSILQLPVAPLIVFMGAGSLLVFYFYLGKMLQHLDPSRAIPTRVRSALDTMAEGLLVIDLKGRIVLANESFAEIIDKPADKLMGHKMMNLAWQADDGSDLAPADAPWVRSLVEGELQRNIVVHLHDEQDQRRTFMCNCSPVLGAGGKHGGVLVSLDDVTQLEEKKVELTKAKAEAEQANHAKTAFLANMSHEIRTPMNAILGFTEVLRRDYEHSEKKRREHLNTIHSSGQHLLALINDILDLSKVESGRLELELMRCSPHQVVAEVMAVLRVKANEKQIALEYQPDDQLPETIITDPCRLRQTLINLVGNAIKFTDRGSVTIQARLATASNQPQLALAVVDTGIGISPEFLDKIFEPFAQADGSVTRQYGGTGLGLAISRRFAHALGGKLTVTSEPGKGSTFSLQVDTGSLEGVPRLAAEQARNIRVQDTQTEASSVTLRPSRILVVDDGPENRELLNLVLKQVGVHVETAENGKQAVELALHQPYDVILMDMQMPIMDGYTAARVLREQGYDKSIVALTANAMKGDEEKCLDAGCSGFLPKPIDLDRLFQTLAEALGGEPSAQQPVATIGQRSEPDMDSTEKAGDCAVSDDSPLISTLPTHKPQFAAIVKKFVVRLDEQLNAMQQALDTNDLPQLAKLAHWLKGSGGNVGFDDFTEPARELEQFARQGDQQGSAGMLVHLRGLAARIALADNETAELTS
ncbi:MAG: response regulator [Pirellulales bacterium]